MTLSVNYLSALVGRVRIHEASLDKPHFFAHSYGDGNANWNVLKTSATEDNGDTTALSLPTITVNKICLTGAPKIVYTDCRDTVYAAIFLKQMHFHGNLPMRPHLRTNLDWRLTRCSFPDVFRRTRSHLPWTISVSMKGMK